MYFTDLIFNNNYGVMIFSFRWVEEDPFEILESVKICINKAVENLLALGFKLDDVKGNLILREIS